MAGLAAADGVHGCIRRGDDVVAGSAMDALYAGELHPFVPDPGHAVLGRPKGDAGTRAAFQIQPVAAGIAGHRELALIGECEDTDLPSDTYFRNAWEFS